ncbi:MAG: hypothetical protein E7374_02115 [Clostridiales bacterium]|nr:hypothetical protein [Clostridiales bacterium]
MLTLIIFSIGAILSLSLGIAFNIDTMKIWQISVIFICALAIILIINALVATICCKWLPNKIFDNDKFFTPSKKECRFYEKLKIKVWKDRILDLGKLNKFKKNKMEIPKDPEYIKKFILECKKGFLDHFLSIFASILILFAVPKTFIVPMALPMFITSLALNIMPILILRYNIPRLNSILKFLERKRDK